MENVSLYFDLSTLEPIDKAPDISPNWWVSNPDGSREAAFMPDTIFYVREANENEERVYIGNTLYANGEVLIFGIVDEIYWLLDNRHLIGIYARYSDREDEYPEFSKILQGTVVDAVNAKEINHFFIQTDNDVEGYSVSSLGDRIAINHSDNIIELWNPMAGEHIKTIEVPALPLEELCDS